MKHVILIIVVVALSGCAVNEKLVIPDSFDIHATHDNSKINGGFFGFSWDIEDDL